jgi:Sulfotransferase domain
MEKLFDFGMDLMMPMFSTIIMESIDACQQKLDPPYSDGVYFIDVTKEVNSRSRFFLMKKLCPLVIDTLFANLTRSNAFYCNPDCTKYSTRKLNESYRTFTEALKDQYPEYSVNSKWLIVNDTDIEVDYEHMRTTMLSKVADLQRGGDMELINTLYKSGKKRLLRTTNPDGSRKAVKAPRVTYTSYPRSGNTMVRKYFESITGLATGSDQVMKFNLNVALQYTGFMAEGITDDRIWMQKTHFPTKFPYQNAFGTQVLLCCVRNPLDVFVSEFMQIATMTHNNDTNEDFTKFPEWSTHVQQEIGIWKRWHTYWLDKAKS